MKHISSSAVIHSTAKVNANTINIGDNVIIEEDVTIVADTLTIEAGARIGKGASINFKEVKLGFKSVIQENSNFRSLKGQGENFVTGDFSFLGYNQNLLVPHFKIGDYTTIHNSNFITGFEACILGHNCWVGQNTILNSNRKLTIGNNVGIGTDSQLWTHVIHGELLEGCTMFGEHPLTIEDNVWIVGGAVISPNIIVREGSVIMVGSVLTKSTEPRHCYAGVPAKDITDKLNPYKKLSLDEKFEMMKKFIEEFHESTDNVFKENIFTANNYFEFDSIKKELIVGMENIIILKEGQEMEANEITTVFNIKTKFYTKKRTVLEENFMKFNERYRAKFIPIH